MPKYVVRFELYKSGEVEVPANNAEQAEEYVTTLAPSVLELFENNSSVEVWVESVVGDGDGD